MTDAEYIEFKNEFKDIVNRKRRITEHARRIQDLHRWDKNGSHSDAINKAVDVISGMKKELNERMGGYDYGEWLKMSKDLTAIKGRLKQSHTTYANCLKRFENYNLFKINNHE